MAEHWSPKPRVVGSNPSVGVPPHMTLHLEESFFVNKKSCFTFAKQDLAVKRQRKDYSRTKHEDKEVFALKGVAIDLQGGKSHALAPTLNARLAPKQLKYLRTII